jgi:hypothetical protein
MLKKLSCYVARVCIFLVTVALIVGMVGCGGGESYTLTITSTAGGSTTPSEGTHTYEAGTVVNLTATPATGYRFVNWTGNVSTVGNVNAASTTITMNGDYSITANFEKIPVTSYTLTIAVNGSGSTSPSVGQHTSTAGTVVPIIATPASGYGFVNWTGNVGTIANINAASTNITMNSSYYITANFAIGIWDWYDLDAIRNNLSGSYVIMNDLDSTTAGYAELAGPAANGGKGWQPIGSVTSGTSTLGPLEGIGAFSGTLDGQQHKIEGLCINRPDENGVGLFGLVSWGGVIQNLGVVSAEVTGHGAVSILAGCNYGTVSNSYSTGSVTGTDQFIGGLAGFNYGTVRDSYSVVSVTGWGVGGLVGKNAGTVSNSHYNYDEALINGQCVITIGAMFDRDFDEWLANGKYLDINQRLSQEGGYYLINNVNDFKQLLVFGQDSSLKFRLTQDLDLAGEPNFYIPYLAVEFDANGHKILNLNIRLNAVESIGLFGYLATGGKVIQVGVENVNIGPYVSIGGLAGINHGTISNSYSTGSVTGGIIGGLVGENFGTVSNSYSTVSVTGHWSNGGLIGWNHGSVSSSYSTGSVTGNDYVGGLVGQSGGTVSNSFWDIQTSGQATSGGGTGKTNAQMRDIATFSGAGWNIIAVASGQTNSTYIWNIVDGQTYPFLSWQS